MAKTVGFACALKLAWLNKAAQMKEENLSVADYKNTLNEYLAFEIPEGTVRLRKTRDILMNIWYYESDDVSPIREEALSLLKKYPEYAAPIHLCLLYTTYPVVADICKFMGRLLEFQDDVTNAQLTKKLYDEWGERGTLEATCRRVSLTLKEMGLLQPITKIRYAPIKQAIKNTDVVKLLLKTAMHIDGNSYYTFTDLNGFNVLFPFEFEISKEQLMTDEEFSVSNFGGEMSITLK